MSEEDDALGTGAGDSGFNAVVQQSSGESMSAEEPEPVEETSTTEGTTVESAQSNGTAAVSRSSSASQPSSDDHHLAPQDWSPRAEEVLSDPDASPRDYEPKVKLDNGFEYVVGRSNATDGLDNTGARVRPELHQALKTAYNHADGYFGEEDTPKCDYYEAALTVALWHHDEVLAVMAELGYGLRK